MPQERDSRHFPRPAPIDSYAKGGFRFAGLSHRGSLLCLPNGIWAWPVTHPREITEEALARLFADPGEVRLFILGTGRESWTMAAPLRACFRAANITVEVMRTGDAANTYNILLGEGRRIGAGLIAVL